MPLQSSRFLTTSALAFASALAGCGGSGGGNDAPAAPLMLCTEEIRKDWVLDTTEDWYLFPELLPAAVDSGSFATAESLLDALTQTAREQGKDRGFSYLTTRAEDETFFAEGEFIGFGIRTRIENDDRLLILDVFEASPAAEAQLDRGAEVTAIDAGSGFRPIAEWLAEDPDLETALGPPEEGVARGVRFTVDGVAREVTITKRVVTIDPVPDDGIRTLPLAGTAGVGYVNLRTFISTADAELRSAFESFRIAGLTDFVIDLRYNGGGLVRTAELLGDLSGAARTSSDIFSKTRYNPTRAAANDTVRRFRDEPAAVAPVRIAFLTTESTASASELVINSLDPWIEIAIVGADTFGKPVGQSAFDLDGCDDRLRLVTFRTDNALDEGQYFDGLAPLLTFACGAADDLSRAQGDPLEGMTSAALAWLGSGQCESLMSAREAAQKTDLAAPRPELPARPTTAQANLPGLF